MMEPKHISNSQIERKIGSRIGQSFTVTGVLGSGGMGNVYRAVQDHIGREVAIKFLPFDISSDETAIARLTLEARALGQLSHPGIVTTFDFGFTTEREPYLALELVSGETLHAILEREKVLEPTRALPLFIQLAEALSYAHAAFIVHRDVKPHNIMVGLRDEGEFTKILDFGIVKLTSESQHLTRAGEIWGSPFYMSPEQCNGSDVDNRSDIYCLGAVMYRALTGQVPHRGASFAETVARKLNEVPPPFAVSAPQSAQTAELEAVVQKCLRRDPAERYNSMQELRADLLKVYRLRYDREATLPYEQPVSVLPQSLPPLARERFEVETLPAGTPALKVENENARAPLGGKLLGLLVILFLTLVGGVAYGAVTLWQRTAEPPSPVRNPYNSGAAGDSAGNTRVDDGLKPPVSLPPLVTPPPAGDVDTPSVAPATPPRSSRTDDAAVVLPQSAPVKPPASVRKPRVSVPRLKAVPPPEVILAPPPQVVPAKKPFKKKLADAARKAARQPGQTVRQARRVFEQVSDTFKSRRSLSNDPNRFYRDYSGR